MIWQIELTGRSGTVIHAVGRYNIEEEKKEGGGPEKREEAGNKEDTKLDELSQH